MRKDKKWLKEKVRDIARQVGHEYLYINIQTVLELIDQLDEPEVLSQEWIDEYAQGDYDEWVYTEDLENFLVPKQELPVIPKYVADWIAKHRDTFDLYPALKRLEDKPSAWKPWKRIYEWYRMNTQEFVNAYLTGEYEVEEEQKYNVYLGDGQHLVSEDDLKEPHAKIRHQEDRGFLNYNTTFTEQEIKDYDERFWAFAVPVEEVEE